jgi:large subunit ribosomal protein L3
MAGLIGKKLGMTSIFDESQRMVAVTLIEVEPNVVTQVKTEATDGYEAVQVGYGPRKAKNAGKPLQGHYKKAGVEPKHILREFDFNVGEYKPGDEITAELLSAGEFVDVVGTSKGLGFQGVVKRHGFAGVGGRTHGQHNRQRAPGSMGACSFPARVFKGKKLGGRTGGARVKALNLQVMKVVPEKNLVVVSGSVPGANGNYVYILK